MFLTSKHLLLAMKYDTEYDLNHPHDLHNNHHHHHSHGLLCWDVLDMVVVVVFTIVVGVLDISLRNYIILVFSIV